MAELKPAVQLEIPLLPDSVGEELVLHENQDWNGGVVAYGKLQAMPQITEKIEQKIGEIADSDRYPFDISVESFKDSIDAQLEGAKTHLRRLRAIKRELSPGFLRRVFRHICRR
jgi:hypothetical protein